jgi:ATP-dependent Clp protease adapter protein ClpS
MSTDTEIVQDTSTVVQFKPPYMWKVVFLNDDKTPMEFVIDLLIELFGHNEISAQDITL